MSAVVNLITYGIISVWAGELACNCGLSAAEKTGENIVAGTMNQTRAKANEVGGNTLCILGILFWGLGVGLLTGGASLHLGIIEHAWVTGAAMGLLTMIKQYNYLSLICEVAVIKGMCSEFTAKVQPPNR